MAAHAANRMKVQGLSPRQPRTLVSAEVKLTGDTEHMGSSTRCLSRYEPGGVPMASLGWQHDYFLPFM